MLVLTRKEDERIVVTVPSGDEIVIQINDIQSNKVSVGVEADEIYAVDREEVHERKKEQEEI